WNLHAGRLLPVRDDETIDDHTASIIEQLAFSPDNRLLATGTNGGPLKIWEAVSGRLERKLSALRWRNVIAFSPNGRDLAAGCGERVGERDGTHARGELGLWDVSSG